MKEKTSLVVITKERSIVKSFVSFIEVNELVKLGSLNKKFADQFLRSNGATAWKSMSLSKQVGSPIVQKQVESLTSQLKFGNSNFDMGGMDSQSMQQLVYKEK